MEREKYSHIEKNYIRDLNEFIEVFKTPTPKFKQKITIPIDPRLDIILTELGFTIDRDNISFQYVDEEEKVLQEYAETRAYKNKDTLILYIPEFKLKYRQTSNSNLTLLGNPKVSIKTIYDPALKGNLLVDRVYENDEFVAENPSVNLYSIHLRTPKYPDLEKEILASAQRATDKALEDLCINNVWKQFQDTRELIRNSKNPVLKTLKLYLGK